MFHIACKYTKESNTLQVFCQKKVNDIHSCCFNTDNPTKSSMDDINKGIVIDLGSIVIKPYLEFGASSADVEKYVNEYYPGWTIVNPEGPIYVKMDDIDYWAKYYAKDDKASVVFYFLDPAATNLAISSYEYSTSIPIEDVKKEYERNHFTYMGILEYPDNYYGATYMYLSADKTIEAQLTSYAKEGTGWLLSFQPTSETDLNNLKPEI